MSWPAVHRWLEELRQLDAADFDSGLSPEGAREAWRTALAQLDRNTLDRVAALGGAPFETASFIAASTVLTAPLEWLSVLLGRGSRVVLKASSSHTGAAPALVHAARRAGLPLQWTTDRTSALTADLVVAMGSDQTMEQLCRELPDTTSRILSGHRFSVAWVADDQWDEVARDFALYDSRGCFSPQVVFTPLPIEQAVEGLAAAMERAQQQLPVGLVGEGEGARIRSRAALARVTGAEAHGLGWSVHGLDARVWGPAALPRSAAVVSVRDLDEAARLLRPWALWLSLVGSDDAAAIQLCSGSGTLVPLGQMQERPMFRMHDGRDWLVETGRGVKSWRN